MRSSSEAECPSSPSTSKREDDDNVQKDFMTRNRLVSNDSLLHVSMSPSQCPIVYASTYNISFLWLENLHPFDSKKWGNIHRLLVESGKLSSKAAVHPTEASTSDLEVVHSKKYLCSLKSSVRVAGILEVPLVACLPSCIVDYKVLRPMRLQTGGTVLAAALALANGWAINLGGGFHHASSSHGGGFCVYADITLALKFLFLRGKIGKAMIIDLDAHQGNGHENDFKEDDKVYIFDMFNSEIYPRDSKAKEAISRMIPIRCGTSDREYLHKLTVELNAAFDEFLPELIIYNAGTDSLTGDILGLLNLSAQAIIERDELVFRTARQHSSPIVMVTSGGYRRESAKVVADSILNLNDKNLIELK